MSDQQVGRDRGRLDFGANDEVSMDPSDRTRSPRDDDAGSNLSNLGNSFLVYLRTRSADHWLFFAIGVIFGLLIS